MEFQRRNLLKFAAVSVLGLPSLAQSSTSRKPITLGVQTYEQLKIALEKSIGFPVINIAQTVDERFVATFENGVFSFSLYSKDTEHWYSSRHLV